MVRRSAPTAATTAATPTPSPTCPTQSRITRTGVSVLRQLYNQGVRAITQRLNQRSAVNKQAQQALDIVSPLHTLKRGYSITVNANGDIIRNASAFKPGDEFTHTAFAEGEVISEVRQVKP